MTEDRDRGTLTINLEPGAMPIAGTVATPDGEAQFTGWIELAGLIDSAHRASFGQGESRGIKFVDPPS